MASAFVNFDDSPMFQKQCAIPTQAGEYMLSTPSLERSLENGRGSSGLVRMSASWSIEEIGKQMKEVGLELFSDNMTINFDVFNTLVEAGIGSNVLGRLSVTVDKSW